MAVLHVFVLIFCFLQISSAGLSGRLKTYDITSNVHIHTITRRGTMSVPTKEVRFSAFGQNYTLELKPSTHLFSDDFKIKVVHQDGSSDIVEGFDRTNFLEGHVLGDETSQAAVHIDQDNTITGVFTVNGEEISIEPAARHLGDEESIGRHDMIVYKKSDIKEDASNAGLCGSVHPDNPEDFDEIKFKSFQRDDSSPNHRRKRDSHLAPSRICVLYAVADYKFYLDNGQSDELKTANYIAQIINRVNTIYKSTSFSSGSGYGFKFGMMTIHDSATSGDTFYYNSAKTDWVPLELLEAFSRTASYTALQLNPENYCLAHLFTSESFPDSILGLGYIASSVVGTSGGVCSGGNTKNGHALKYNTGWSTSRNIAGSPVLFTQMSLVTAHELGHNWGSEHDPDNDECSPSSLFFNEGKYLMYAYSVSGKDPNNDIFSSCSVGSISAVINNKAGYCFIDEEEETLCGNGRIDDGEECDGGFLGSVGRDKCCNPNCTFTQFSVCSSVNKECCFECQMAPSTYLCKGEVAEFCYTDTFCTGSSFDCPQPPNSKPDGSSCLDGGSCQSGVCVSYCEARGYDACACEDLETSCMRCCRSGPDGQCTAQDTTTPAIVSDGTPCIQGYCEAGTCIKVTTNLIERLWSLVDAISFDFLVEAFKTNMVGCVIGFSLVLYIPLCIVIWCLDRRRKKQFEKENSFTVRRDRGLDKDEDKRPVGRGDKPESRPRTPLSNDGEYAAPLPLKPNNSRNRIQPLSPQPSSSLA